MKKIIASVIATVIVLILIAVLPLVLDDKENEDNMPEESVSQEDQRKNFTINGYDISAFKVTYPSDYSAAQAADVHELCETICELCGYKPELIRFSDDIKTPLIVIGTGKTYESALDCEVYTEGNRLYIGGNNHYANIRAISKFTSGFLKPDENTSDIVIEKANVKYPYHEIDIVIGGWCTSSFTVDKEGYFKDMSDAGLNVVSIARPANERDVSNILKWCAKYDIKCLWVGAAIQNVIDLDSYVPVIDSYISAPVSWGDYIYDEPSADKFDGLYGVVGAYSKEYPGKIPFINLSPLYSHVKYLGTDSYDEYLKLFFEKVNPGFCSVDIYPLNTNTINDDYLESLNVVADYCRRNGTKWSVYIQGVSYIPGKRAPTKRDLEFQIFSSLSFGASGYMYFTYLTPYNKYFIMGERFEAALIDTDGNKTKRWYYAQEVNNEVEFLSPVITQYKNLGAFSVNADKGGKYMLFSNPYTAFDTIKEVISDSPLLFGCFEKENAATAFTIVNMSDLNNDIRKADVKIRLDKNKSITMYRNAGVENISLDSEGYLHLKLNAGEGIFITVE